MTLKEDKIVYLVEDRNQWHAFVKGAVNVRIPLRMGSFLTSSATVMFPKKAFCAMGLITWLVS
jgi:hypothetical protein